MPNYFTENADICRQFDQLDLAEVIRLREGDFAEAKEYPYAPRTVEDAKDSYRRVLALVGDLTGNFIAPRAEEVDRTGPRLVHEENKVYYAPGTQEAMDALAAADLMGFTLPRRFGGLNFPTSAYVVAIELVARADAALMTLFGLQDIAETINDFADEDQKQRYLPRFSTGEVTGAMVLTEPDAGSDLQAVMLKAAEDPNNPGKWLLNGVKRFITNGCGEVLLVLARSEAGTKDGRGLSLFLCDSGPTVQIRRIEDKLGIHGSPTCELQFNNTPAELVGKRRRGLSQYVMALMNGARVAIAAQGLGIAEAAYREALAYAVEREQFGKAIIDMPPVTDIILNMKISVETGRALLYDTARVVDIYQAIDKRTETMQRGDEGYSEMRERGGAMRKLANILTPMSKYLLCETALKVTSDAIQVHGGSGFMRDYPVERLWRDARITNIYEGTSQLQVVAILAGLHGGALNDRFAEFAARRYEGELQSLAELAHTAHGRFDKALAFIEEKKDRDYDSLVGHNLADIACDVYCSYLLLEQARTSDEKKAIAERFIPQAAMRSKHNLDIVLSDNTVTLTAGRHLLAADVPRE